MCEVTVNNKAHASGVHRSSALVPCPTGQPLGLGPKRILRFAHRHHAPPSPPSLPDPLPLLPRASCVRPSSPQVGIQLCVHIYSQWALVNCYQGAHRPQQA